jgi:hypothetical protein
MTEKICAACGPTEVYGDGLCAVCGGNEFCADQEPEKTNGLRMEDCGRAEMWPSNRGGCIQMRLTDQSHPNIQIEFANDVDPLYHFTKTEALRVARAIKALPALIEAAREAVQFFSEFTEAITDDPQHIRVSGAYVKDLEDALAQLEPATDEQTK